MQPGRLTKEPRVSRRKIPSKAALVDALTELDGNQAAVARRFGCHRSLIWQYIDNDPELRALTDELQEVFIDEAESQLFKLIREGQPNAIIFFLKTKARHRGYSERLELLPLNRQDIQIELGNPGEIENDHAKTFNRNGTTVALLEQ
jgi:hypothetical protein